MGNCLFNEVKPRAEFDDTVRVRARTPLRKEGYGR